MLQVDFIALFADDFERTPDGEERGGAKTLAVAHTPQTIEFDGETKGRNLVAYKIPSREALVSQRVTKT